MKKILAPLAVAFALSPVASFAQQTPKFYVGAAYGMNTIEPGPGAPNFKSGVLTATLGYRLMENLAVEGLVGTGVSDDTKNIQGDSVKISAKSFRAIFLRPNIKVTDNLELFGKVGHFSGKISFKNSEGSDSGTEHDMAYGVGAAYYVAKNTALTLDYTQWYKKNEGKVDGFGLGLRYDF